MGDSNHSKPGSRPAPASSQPETETPAGRVVHDARGNAVWSWVKDTARTAVDSTSRLLKRLEVPELKLEDTGTKTPQPDCEADRDSGGGYNPYGGPYGGSNPSRDSPGSRRGSLAGGSARATSRVSGPAGGPGRAGVPTNTPGSVSSRAKPDPGDGYDPYGKSITRKPSR